MRQLIIARKDLHMSPGKLAVQVSHASMAFLLHPIQENARKVWKYNTLNCVHKDYFTGEISQQHFRSCDLEKIAKEGYEQGLDSISYRPKDPDRPLENFEICENEVSAYVSDTLFSKDIFEEWICGACVKTVCEAHNRNHLMKAVTMAEEMGLKEGIDFFLIRDKCLTELEPEEFDENGAGWTLTCIGFRPLPDDQAHLISKKYHLYV